MVQAEQIYLIIHQNQQSYALQAIDERRYPLQAGYPNRQQIRQHIEGKINLKARLGQPRTSTTKASCVDIKCFKGVQILSNAVLHWRSPFLGNSYPPLLPHLDKSIDSPSTPEASKQRDRWQWYVEQEFELLGGAR